MLPVDAQATRRGHPVVLEAAARVQAFVLEEEAAGPHPHAAGEEVGLLQDGAAFADGDDVVLGTVERHQFAEPPDPGEVEAAFGAGALRAPAVLEEVEVLGDGELGPVVLDVEQAGAFSARDADVLDGVGGAARGVDALLKGGFGHGKVSVRARRRDVKAG